MRYTSFLLFSFLYFQSVSQIDTLRFYALNGTVAMVDGQLLETKVFNSSPEFVHNSPVVLTEQGQLVYIRLINLDDEEHALEIPSLVSIPIVSPGDSSGILLTLNSAGIYRYFDPLNFPYNSHIGLSGILHVKSTEDETPYFYWDLSEHSIDWNNAVLSGNYPGLNSYSPNYFTVNGNADMEIDMDPLAKILGSVGNEFRLVIVNNGLSIHSIHLHGYHGIILESSKNEIHLGWEKDTFPVYPNEYMMISIIPDKPGEYPIHDHNLVAVTGGGMYHAGMISTMVITP